MGAFRERIWLRISLVCLTFLLLAGCNETDKGTGNKKPKGKLEGKASFVLEGTEEMTLQVDSYWYYGYEDTFLVTFEDDRYRLTMIISEDTGREFLLADSDLGKNYIGDNIWTLGLGKDFSWSDDEQLQGDDAFEILDNNCFINYICTGTFTGPLIEFDERTNHSINGSFSFNKYQERPWDY